MRLLLTAGLMMSSILKSPAQEQPLLLDKLEAALAAAAIGDGMGAPVESWTPDRVRDSFPDWDFAQFLPSTKPKDIQSGKGKGHGRFTDDFLEIEAIIRVYNVHQDHLDAYDYADLFIQEMTSTKVYVPERKEERFPIDRPAFWPEKYVYHRIAINHVEPRSAGHGNWLNNGFSSITLPSGAVNAGDPWRAYDEVSTYGVAHTESFALEAGAVNAAAYAEAFSQEGTLNSVLHIAKTVAKDGTKLALHEALEVTSPEDDPSAWARKVRKVYLQYAQLPPKLLTQENPEVPHRDKSGSNVGRPSRVASIENLPVAFAALKYGQGDYLKTLRAIIYYGRDCESIALVATSILGALYGTGIIPESLMKASEKENKRDYGQMAKDFLETIKTIHAKDENRLNRRTRLLMHSPTRNE
nr:ADP-ribosylglycohydrolase family protein [Cyclobacteriaceae bacterium HetDA_MAG_MS6]